MTEPGRIDSTIGGRDKDGRRAAGNKGRRDDNVLRGDMRSGQRRLFRLILRRHFLGVARGGLGLLEFLVLDGDEFGPERNNLLFRRRPDVGRGHDGSELAGGGDRLQPRDADAHDKDFRGLNHARRRHHHRNDPAIFGGGVDDGAIAGDIGLARKDVHRLRPCDARHQFHREGANARRRQGLQRINMAVRIHDRDDGGAWLGAGDLRRAWPPDPQDNIGVLNSRRGARARSRPQLRT